MCTRYFIELESEDAEEIREIMAELNRRELERAGDATRPPPSSGARCSRPRLPP